MRDTAASWVLIVVVVAAFVTKSGDQPSIYDSLRTIAENAAKQMPAAKCK